MRSRGVQRPLWVGHHLVVGAAFVLLLAGGGVSSSSISAFPTLRVPGIPPEKESDECFNLTTVDSGVPPDAVLGVAELIRGFQSFGDLSLFAPVHEKLKHGAVYYRLRLRPPRGVPASSCFPASRH